MLLFVFLFVGLGLIMVGAVYGMRHPRRSGEAFSKERRTYFAITLLGALFVSIFAVYALTGQIQG